MPPGEQRVLSGSRADAGGEVVDCLLDGGGEGVCVGLGLGFGVDAHDVLGPAGPHEGAGLRSLLVDRDAGIASLVEALTRPSMVSWSFAGPRSRVSSSFGVSAARDSTRCFSCRLLFERVRERGY